MATMKKGCQNGTIRSNADISQHRPNSISEIELKGNGGVASLKQ